MNPQRLLKLLGASLLAPLLTSGTLCAEDKKPLKVYLLAGQSNMTGMVSSSTLQHLRMFPETAAEFADVFDKDGAPVLVDEVHVSQWQEKDCGKLAPKYGGGKGERFGPEYTFGIYMHKALDEPILLIKTAQGGKSLNYHFRPPSAGDWTPPAGHPDLIKKDEARPAPLPIPSKMDLPKDYMPSEDLLPRRPGRFGSFMGLKPMRGLTIGEVNGIHPLYITASPEQKFPGDPLLEGDVILGVDGSGFRQNPDKQWNRAFFGSKAIDGDWKLSITRWRKGEIDTFEFDIAQTLEGGRAGLPAHIASMKAKAIQAEKDRGGYYRDMIQHTKAVLKDIKTYHPDYDEETGYELAGFVWFQGYNDMVSDTVYPNREHPRGYDQYTWLLEHLLRDVRKDLNAPKLPSVIGIMGIGGIQDEGIMGNFQKAMAAVALKPEFKDSVVNVHTGKYWDHQLEALSIKSREIRNKKLELELEGLKGDALKEAYEKYRAEHMTPQEEEILKKGISNQGYHYHGSGKIMAGIGKGFAEAMIDLENKSSE